MGIPLDTSWSCSIGTVQVSTQGYDYHSVSSYCSYIFCTHIGISLDTKWSCFIKTVPVSTQGYETEYHRMSSYIYSAVK